MKKTQSVICLIGVIVFIEFCSSDYLFAQRAVITDTLAYTQISNLIDITPTSRMRTSADGSKIIFTGNYKQVFSMNSDGSQVNRVFDYETFRPGTPPFRDPFVDISGDGSVILWTDGANEIFTANFDGGNTQAIATLIPNEPPFGDIEPNIPLSPRLTYDGSKVFFIHVSDNPNIAGIYTIASNGSGLTKLFSYRDMSVNLFGLDGNEYNQNAAFTNYLDISDDGSKGVFSTYNIDIVKGHTIVFNNSSLSILQNYAPAFSGFHNTGIGQLSMSRDGKRVAMQISDQSGWLSTTYVMDSNGGGQTELPFTFYGSSHIQLDSTGSNAIAINHLPEYGNGISDPFPISYIDIDSIRIWDLTVYEGDPDFNFRGARSPAFTHDGKTVFFFNGIVRGDSVQQIWKLDINPDTLMHHPSFHSVWLVPYYVPFDKSNSSTFTIYLASGSTVPQSIFWDTFHEGGYVFRGLRTFDGSENLVDDGTLGDITAGDSIYAREGVFADLLEPPIDLTIRFHADYGKYITSIEAIPIFIRDSVFVSIEDDKKQSISNKYELYTNFPNPFNPSTKISYSIQSSSLVTLIIYNMQGREIKTLVSEFQQADTYSVDFNASKLSSGIYFYSLQVGDDFLDTKKMLLLK
ncbi:T9SS type A sorting domain-containing protein [Bacteroidota bacterium]